MLQVLLRRAKIVLCVDSYPRPPRCHSTRKIMKICEQRPMQNLKDSVIEIPAKGFVGNTMSTSGRMSEEQYWKQQLYSQYKPSSLRDVSDKQWTRTASGSARTNEYPPNTVLRNCRIEGLRKRMSCAALVVGSHIRQGCQIERSISLSLIA